MNYFSFLFIFFFIHNWTLMMMTTYIHDTVASTPNKIDKVIQLYETMLTRHCTMIVGPSGGGKTVVVNALVKAQTAMGFPTKCVTINPKVNFMII